MTELATALEDRVSRPLTRVVRLGNWHLVLPEQYSANQSKVIVAKIVSALESDSRVLSVEMPEISDYWTS